MRKFMYIGAVFVMTAAVMTATAGADSDNNVVIARGEASFSANHFAQITFQWHNDKTQVARGAVLTVRDTVTPADFGGHTFTIVKASDVPNDLAGAFGETCFPDPSSPNQGCAVAAGHFATDPPTSVVNAGPPGLDEPGDSLLVPQGGSVSAPVSAARGTTLHFICTFHPWMQGTLEVR